MSLYDRKNNYSYVRTNEFASEGALVNFVKTTYKFFAASLLLATIGALIGLQYFSVVAKYSTVFFVAEIVAYFALIFVRQNQSLRLGLLFVFTTLSGVTLVPLLGYVISVSGLSAVWQALGMTTIVFGVMSIYGIKTTKDLGSMGKTLIISALVVFVFSLLNAFLFHSTGLQLVIAGAVTIIFSLLIAYDTQNMIRGLYSSPIDAAISLYVNFLNIFVSLLQIIGLTSNNRN